MDIVNYDGTQSEFMRIVTEKSAAGLVLVYKVNTDSENVLGFSNTPITPPTPVELRIEELKEQNLVLMDAIATLYEMLEGGAT